MGAHQAGLHLNEILRLLDNKRFIRDSHKYWEQYRAHARKIGSDRQEWERQAEAFMERFLDPFIAKWKAYPLPDNLLSSPIWQKKKNAVMTGRWGVIPVYPWTTDAEVKRQRRRIQRVIGKKHQDFRLSRMAHIARWLEDSHVSTRTGKRPSRSDIAAVVWSRLEGLKRPSKKKVIANLSYEEEEELIQHYKKTKGVTLQQAVRLLYAKLRGKEAPAAAMVRMALKRTEIERNQLLVTDPKKTDQLGLAITLMLRELPTSASSPQNLEAIRDKAVTLGNLLLPPESPAK